MWTLPSKPPQPTNLPSVGSTVQTCILALENLGSSARRLPLSESHTFKVALSSTETNRLDLCAVGMNLTQLTLTPLVSSSKTSSAFATD